MESLGLDLKILVAQVVNFGILFFILSKVLYKPLIKLLDDRAEKIKKSLDNSQKIEEELAKLKEREVELLATAKAQAQEERKNLIDLAQSEREKIIADAKTVAQGEIQKGLDTLRAEETQMRERLVKEFMSQAVDILAKKLKDDKTKHPLLDKALT